jgi:dTDP-4-dehydrorhamnose 3,5-epimerase-like enzyme
MDMKYFSAFIIIAVILSCSPKGPQTYLSPLVGKHKNQLITEKGIAKTIKVYSDYEIYIYTVREEYFGNKNPEIDPAIKPSKVFDIEHIYYIDSTQTVYKYQVWKKKVSLK